MKKRKYITHPVPFMNKGLRQEIYKKCTLHNKFLKQKTNKNWEAYRKQRHFVRMCNISSFFQWYIFVDYLYESCFKIVICCLNIRVFCYYV
jgi:hypothetical protein